ncbi:MAG: NUDIX hydrolase [Halioglobus sp.]
MSDWYPHVTVAVVVERDGRYLMVEERDKFSGEMVFNQPAGHLERDETLEQGALRECLEETGWQVELTGVLGVSTSASHGNGITYVRTTFCANALNEVAGATLDPDIHAVHWLSYEEITANSARMRSPLVIASIDRQRLGKQYSMDLIFTA